MPKTPTNAPREGSCKAVADPDVAPAGVGLCHAGALGAQGVTNAAAQGTILGADSVPMPEATVLATNTSNGKRWQGVTPGRRSLLPRARFGGWSVPHRRPRGRLRAGAGDQRFSLAGKAFHG
jgi:hypothetical protein